MLIKCIINRLAIQNMTWGGKQGFQTKPVEPFIVPYDDQGTMGIVHTERKLTYVIFIYTHPTCDTFLTDDLYIGGWKLDCAVTWPRSSSLGLLTGNWSISLGELISFR